MKSIKFTCFHPNNFFTAGLVNEKRLFKLDIGPLLDDSPSSVSMVPRVTHRTRKRVPPIITGDTALTSITAIWYSPRRCVHKHHKLKNVWFDN